MAEVRAGVDAVDLEILKLLVRRFNFMDAAARIKVDRGAIRDEGRKAEVLANVDSAAHELGLDRALVERFYEMLIEASIAYELNAFDRLNAA